MGILVTFQLVVKIRTFAGRVRVNPLFGLWDTY